MISKNLCEAKLICEIWEAEQWMNSTTYLHDNYYFGFRKKRDLQVLLSKLRYGLIKPHEIKI